jgi:ectoine hydroxylase-related dioxygenase (phytanoyl-CoA dioxygenase family)
MSTSTTINDVKKTTDLSSLPPLTSDYPLAPEQLASFRRDGHILLRGVTGGAELLPYRNAVNDFVRGRMPAIQKERLQNTYGKAFIQIGNIWESDDVVKKFVFARRFAKIAADLLGATGARMYHDQALFKEGHGGFTPFHQDQFYWPLQHPTLEHHSVTMWMPLVDITPDMGTMHFASGSHAGKYIGDLPISDRSEEILRDLIRDKGYPIVQSPAMKAGDATFHAGWTLHGAPGNPTHTMREVMTIIWIAEGTRVGEPANDSQKGDAARFFPDRKPGDMADTHLNPLLFHRE